MLDLRSQTPKGRLARAKILAAAEGLFISRGFHGASVRDIATAARLPLATVVYHFAKKQQLYAEVLTAIGDELEHQLDPVDSPEQLAAALVEWTLRNPRRVVLVLRELLDNPPRVAHALQFPLAPFLRKAAAIAASAPAAGSAPELCVLHIVGGISYVLVARPTVDKMLGRSIDATYQREALAFARRALGLDVITSKEKPHASRAPGPAGSSRARPRRPANDR